MRPIINTALLDALLRESDDEEPVPPTVPRPELAAHYAESMNTHPEVERKWKSPSFSRTPRR